MAPHVVSQALKAAVLCSAVFEKLGFEVDPKPNEIRHDIIQSIKFGDPDKVTAFCQGIQKVHRWTALLHLNLGICRDIRHR